ncbi:hypothetical protein BDV96DRAFT_283487 [Lophiotrema nucula]|uniref:18S rRNA factor 2 n=1 Tax=Lophiotrema nucula TaxID=690887 RepID=A0A6A5ZN16_9PLEO|nr:hypothetical protein BDV96DRAFT_283487 [Lophiotrema nucula]
MATRKRNEWLDAEDSDEDIQGYNSEEESRAQLLPSAKRQKVSHTSDSASEGSDAAEPQEGAEDDAPSEDEVHDKPKKDRSGIIYLSRVPPFMKPSVLRSLLTPHGAIGRIFCTPESSTNRTSRLKSGGTRRKLFLDGWVEFLSKRDAKTVAQMLNAQIIGGKKRSKWHDEVWNIRYLRGVKWSHLVEQIQNENAERAARMRAEIAQSTRENKRFLANVESGKMVAGMEAKRRRKEEHEVGDGDGDGGEVQVRSLEREEKGPRRTFKQREIQLKGKKPTDNVELAQKVMSSIM